MMLYIHEDKAVLLGVNYVSCTMEFWELLLWPNGSAGYITASYSLYREGSGGRKTGKDLGL